jgi:hypothetical protein
MTDSSNSYGGWCTNWAGYDVPQLWAFLQYETTDPNFDQATAWRRTYELIAYYQSELRTKRDELVAKWSPQHSPAAQVFVQYVDDLLGSMDKTATQAYDNGDAIAGITLALADAKRKIGDLNNQWLDSEQKEKQPRMVAAGKGGAISVPQVPANWRDQLKQEAAKVMYSTDTAVLHYTSQMQVPTQFEPKARANTSQDLPVGSGRNGPSPSSGPGSSSASSRVPVIPPPPPTPPGPVLTGGSLAGSGAATLLPPSGGPPFVDTPGGRVFPPGGVIGPGGFLPPGVAGPPRVPGPRPGAGPRGLPGVRACRVASLAYQVREVCQASSHPDAPLRQVQACSVVPVSQARSCRGGLARPEPARPCHTANRQCTPAQCQWRQWAASVGARAPVQVRA